jgi:hypothetical protein
MSDEMYRKYRAEIDRLEREIAHYERQWTKVPRFAWAAALCPVAGLLAGWGAALVALLVTGALIGVRAYLIAVRRSENEWTRDRLQAEIGAAPDLDGTATAATRT